MYLTTALLYLFGIVAFGCFMVYLSTVTRMVKHDADEWEDYRPPRRERIRNRVLLGVATTAVLGIVVLTVIKLGY